MAKTLYLDPGPGKYPNEDKIRHMMEVHAAYAESGPTFDQSGDYLCGTCYFRGLPDKCAVVGEVDISMDHGGCRRWEIGEPTGKALPKKSNPSLVGYGEREDGFGCKRCEYASLAKESDGKRTLWCKFWGARVQPNSCCEENDGSDLKQPYLIQIKPIKE